jgi:threonine dehydratase
MTVSRATIIEAATRIASFIRKTPIMHIAAPGIEKSVCLKLELFQHTGSFKPRGAFNNLVGAKIPNAGVAAASGGNHGAAVAYAAKSLNIPARIFVPGISSPAKVARIAAYGATIVQEGANYQEAVLLCEDYVRKCDALNIHAYNTEATLNGQGTLGRELEEQAPELDTILVAVGGGGLIGGIASWYQSKSKIIGVEPETCNCLHAALAAGDAVTIKPSGLAADSLGAS